MALNPADIATVSRLLDEALALDPAKRESWLAALPAEHQRHAEALRDMLAQEAQLDTDPRLAAMPKLATDDAVAHAGDRIGPYRLLHEIGRGGMGSVWLAERADGAYKRQVALKLPRLAWGAGLAERMAREREIGMLLEHPNIARLYDAGVDERGRPFLALEYVDGQPIDAWCEAQGLTVRDRLRLFAQVIKAVAYAHGRLVVHRDLKPSNVLVTPDGQAHLLDFGIAKLLLEAGPGEPGLTQEQGRVLTPHYASPEQVAGQAITVQSDVYSLGVLLYELLAGTLPIAPKRGTLGAVEEAILLGDAPLASSRVKDRVTARALHGEVDAILAKAMQREPARRYATADALALDIERHLNGETVTARPDSVAYRLRKAVRRHWVGVAAVSAVLVAVLTGSGVAVVQAQRAARSAERERVVKEFVADVFRANSRVDPKNAALRPASTQALIEGGAELIQQRFAGQPDLQAELFGMVGQVFADMGAYRVATDYATRRVEALATLRAKPTEQASGLLALAEALIEDGKHADAEPRVRRALEMSPPQSDARLNALVMLGRIHDSEARPQAIDATLREIDDKLASRGPSASPARAWALALRARRMTDLNRFDDALPIYQKAIDSALLSEGHLSTTAIWIRLVLSVRLAQARMAKQSEETFAAANAALRELGGAHNIRAAFRGAQFTFFRCCGSNMKATDALAALEGNRAELMATNLPVPSWFLAQIEFYKGVVLFGNGNVVDGWLLLERVAPELRQANSQMWFQSHIVHLMGAAAMSGGRHDLADNLLREGLALRRQMGEGNHPWAAFDYVFIAWNLLMQGQTEGADTILDEAPQFAPMLGEGTDTLRYNRALVQIRAQVRLAADEPMAALKILENTSDAAGQFPFPKDELPLDLATYNELLGEAMCAVGRRTQGLPLLTRRFTDLEEVDIHPHAPWLARLRAVTGLCAAGAGERATALRYASEARAAFTAQPGVSPYYKAPLIRLERALGLKLPPV